MGSASWTARQSGRVTGPKRPRRRCITPLIHHVSDDGLSARPKKALKKQYGAKMNCVKHMDQRTDGGFDYFVVFGDKSAPWDAPDHLVVQCASENDADKLVKIIEASDGD